MVAISKMFSPGLRALERARERLAVTPSNLGLSLYPILVRLCGAPRDPRKMKRYKGIGVPTRV